MAEEKKSKKKEKNTVNLPKAWHSVKHRNEMAQAKTNYEDTWKAVFIILGVLLFLFVIMGGVSQTAVIKFILEWSHKVGEAIADWINSGNVITNNDGVYYVPK